MLPDAASDPRGDTTALAVALGGAICPVPFVMSVAALRIAGSPGRTRRARAAVVVATATMFVQAALIAAVVLGVLG